ncbi:hypothetical protein [Enterococcus faecalis]|uniref:hypothetical protein n=1 Tax=Enterococcus faecalis TaxID=1351 RepID=UPI00242CCEB3|nr:hypothetical protein [Enterococcus faecalis]
MQLNNLNEIHDWAQNNLLSRKQAAKITGQNYDAFSSSLRRNNIKPFLEIGDEPGPSIIRLYLREDIEKYAKQLEEKRQKRQ